MSKHFRIHPLVRANQGTVLWVLIGFILLLSSLLGLTDIFKSALSPISRTRSQIQFQGITDSLSVVFNYQDLCTGALLDEFSNPAVFTGAETPIEKVWIRGSAEHSVVERNQVFGPKLTISELKIVAAVEPPRTIFLEGNPYLLYLTDFSLSAVLDLQSLLPLKHLYKKILVLTYPPTHATHPNQIASCLLDGRSGSGLTWRGLVGSSSRDIVEFAAATTQCDCNDSCSEISPPPPDSGCPACAPIAECTNCLLPGCFSCTLENSEHGRSFKVKLRGNLNNVGNEPIKHLGSHIYRARGNFLLIRSGVLLRVEGKGMKAMVQMRVSDITSSFEIQPWKTIHITRGAQKSQTSGMWLTTLSHVSVTADHEISLEYRFVPQELGISSSSNCSDYKALIYAPVRSVIKDYWI